MSYLKSISKIIWHDENEIIILRWVLFSLISLIIVECQFPVWQCISGSWLTKLLTHDGTKLVAEALLSGLVSAYVFYVFVDLLPKVKKQDQIITLLNSLIGHLLNNYKSNSFAGPLLPLLSLGHEKLVTLEGINELEHTLLAANREEFPLDSQAALQRVSICAKERLADFKLLLGMAASLSPEHARKWLVMISHVEQLAIAEPKPICPMPAHECWYAQFSLFLISVKDWINTQHA